MKKRFLSIALTLCMLLTLMPTAVLAVAYTSVTVIWDDNNNQDGMRPDSVAITLREDGDEISNTISNADEIHSGANEWSCEFGSGYFVGIDAVAGYTSQISGSAFSYSITMTRDLSTPATAPSAISPSRAII